ncbi:MAG: helix-turn-helix transcriptional regulator [Candidatus Aenigmarchaeota archaeon]|nr:helix-turn-helix transcriptional regulator [Candidatus Aenigmarchaeota archaeon]
MKNASYRTFFKAFSNNTRFEIIRLLKNSGSKNVTEICKSLRFKQSRVSRNLACLMGCGFVDVKRDGKERIYSLNKETIYPMVSLIDKHINNYQKHLVKCGALK